jgi:pilus assembly protein Flp/PilA
MYHKSLHKQKEKGQGLVEYALILVLVAIVVIAALMILGPIIGNVFSKVNSSLSGIGGVGGGSSVSCPAYTAGNGQCFSNFSTTHYGCYTGWFGSGSAGMGCYCNTTGC